MLLDDLVQAVADRAAGTIDAEAVVDPLGRLAPSAAIIDAAAIGASVRDSSLDCRADLE
jgi:hypothetical protein